MAKEETKEQEEQMAAQQAATQEGAGAPPELSDIDYLHQRTAKRHPDMTFEDDDAYRRQMRADADEDDKRLQAYDEEAKQTSELFENDPRSAEFWVAWRKNPDRSPIAYFVKTYGVDKLREALDDPAFADMIEESDNAFRESFAEGKEYGETVQKNLDNSLDTIDKYAQENGLSEEETDKLVSEVFERFKHIQLGIVTADDLDWVRKIASYDKDMEEAREEGEIAGRNTKIREQLRKPKETDGVAALNGGASNRPAANIGLSGALDEYQSGQKAASEAPERRDRQRYI